MSLKEELLDTIEDMWLDLYDGRLRQDKKEEQARTNIDELDQLLSRNGRGVHIRALKEAHRRGGKRTIRY